MVCAAVSLLMFGLYLYFLQDMIYILGSGTGWLRVGMYNFSETYSTVNCVKVHCIFEAGSIQDPLQLSEDEFKKIVKINFMASWFLMKAVCRRMRDLKSGGSVIFLSSINGAERGLYPGAAAFASCSAGIQQLARVSSSPVILLIFISITAILLFASKYLLPECISALLFVWKSYLKLKFHLPVVGTSMHSFM